MVAGYYTKDKINNMRAAREKEGDKFAMNMILGIEEGLAYLKEEGYTERNPKGNLKADPKSCCSNDEILPGLQSNHRTTFQTIIDRFTQDR